MTSYRPALPSVRVSLTDKQLHPRPRCLSLQLLAPARLFHRGAVLLGVPYRDIYGHVSDECLSAVSRKKLLETRHWRSYLPRRFGT